MKENKVNDLRTALERLLGRGKPASERTKALNAPVADAPAAPTEAKPFRIWVRGADGNLVSKPATAAETLDYANRDSTWRRIA